MKQCNKCGVTKPLEMFHNKVGGRQAYCRECMVSHMRLMRFGISQLQFDEALASQGGVCAVCGTDTPTGGRAPSWHVDHDHSTGRFRGILCGSCNIGLGHFKDSSDSLRSAAMYLDKEV